MWSSRQYPYHSHVKKEFVSFTPPPHTPYSPQEIPVIWKQLIYYLLYETPDKKHVVCMYECTCRPF